MIWTGVAEANSMIPTTLFTQAWLPDATGRPWATGLWGEPVRGRDSAAARHPTMSVLLVEDDTTIAEMYRVQLEYDGYKVTLVTTGRAALAAMAAARPDIILLDLLLPDRSGLEVMVELKQAFPQHPPVVILSNYGEPAMIERGLALGAVEYLVKSRVTPDSVSRAIPSWVEKGRSGEPPQEQ
jgi:CheY-like chemotaxis protein